MRFSARLAIFAVLLAACGLPVQARVKNIIVMIGDGAGFNTLQAVRLYTGKPLAMDGGGWVRIAQSTFPEQLKSPPAGAADPGQDPNLVYSPSRAWDTTPVAGPSKIPGFASFPAGFAGYEWTRAAAPDSANTMSAMMTGAKSYNNAINMAGDGKTPLPSLAEIAHANGRAVGVVTTVELSDATPAAGGGAHAANRAEGALIAGQLFGGGILDVIAGAGAPDSYNDGLCNLQPPYKKATANQWISPELWAALTSGQARSDQNGAAGPTWTLVRDPAAVRALAKGRRAPPEKLAIIPAAFTAMQFCRPDGGKDQFGADYAAYTPFATPRLKNLPSLPDMALAALNRLGQNQDGFFLMVEGGAIDRAMHANNFGRMVEEYMDFNDTVRQVMAWIGRPGGPGWKDTLLIVTADHDHNLYGPQGASDPFQPLTDHGPGKLPGYAWFGKSHSNNLVPLFAYGAGADHLAALAAGVDFYADAQGRRFGRGRYLDQTDLGKFLLDQAR